jgi:hypothetical protein
MTKIAGSRSASESGSISQRHGSADTDPDPVPHQNGMDPQHRFKAFHSQLAGQPMCRRQLLHILINMQVRTAASNSKILETKANNKISMTESMDNKNKKRLYRGRTTVSISKRS